MNKENCALKLVDEIILEYSYVLACTCNQIKSVVILSVCAFWPPNFCVRPNPLVITIFSSPSRRVLTELLMHDVISPHTS